MKMKITIITDNTIYNPALKSEWGFSCLVEVEDTTKILFDTGSSGSVLLHNMEQLHIAPKDIGCVFISHNHWDHTGGLDDFLSLNRDVKLCLPYSFSFQPEAKEVIKVKDSVKVYENIFSTGELSNIEQSLVVNTEKGLVVIAGCSHPGVGNILKSASQFGSVVALIGGLHGFREFDLVKDLDVVCVTHCTQYKEEIRKLYPGKFIEGGSGRVIEI